MESYRVSSFCLSSVPRHRRLSHSICRTSMGHSSIALSRVPLQRYTVMSFSIHLLLDTSVVSSVRLFQIRLPESVCSGWTYALISLREASGCGMAGSCVCLTSQETAQLRLYHSTPPPISSVHESQLLRSPALSMGERSVGRSVCLSIYLFIYWLW